MGLLLRRLLRLLLLLLWLLLWLLLRLLLLLLLRLMLMLRVRLILLLLLLGPNLVLLVRHLRKRRLAGRSLTGSDLRVNGGALVSEPIGDVLHSAHLGDVTLRNHVQRRRSDAGLLLDLRFLLYLWAATTTGSACGEGEAMGDGLGTCRGLGVRCGGLRLRLWMIRCCLGDGCGGRRDRRGLLGIPGESGDVKLRELLLPALFQFLQDTLIDTPLLKVDAGGIDDVLNDLLVDGANDVVRHGGLFRLVQRKKREARRCDVLLDT